MGGCCGKARDGGNVELAPGYGKRSGVLQHQQKSWQATGVVSLRDSGIKDFPSAVWAVSDNVRVVDVSMNRLTALPLRLNQLTKLERLVASHNQIMQLEFSFAFLTTLKMLDLEGNRLPGLPSEIGALAALETLKLSGNRIEQLPDDIQNCVKLKQLHVASNSLVVLPSALSSCSNLESIDASSNSLVSLPSSLGQLPKLRSMLLNGNKGLDHIPGELLVNCTLLHTLELHETAVTREVMQQTEGYRDFEMRRQAKFSKAIGGGTMLSRDGVDEGIDVALK